MKEDLYLIYAGKNPDSDRPIIKAHINPLVMWIWTGVLVMVFGTLIALVPNAVPVRVHRVVPAAVHLPAGREHAPVSGAGD